MSSLRWGGSRRGKMSDSTGKEKEPIPAAMDKREERSEGHDPTNDAGRAWAMPSAHLLLVVMAVALSLASLAPSAKESFLSLFDSTSYMEAYMGDGILVGDSETNLPFSTISWTISQAPTYGNSRHTVSIFAVPERVARRHIYRYKANYTSEECYTVNKTEFSVGMRSYIYFLPKQYLKHSKYDGSEAYFDYEFIDCGYKRDEPGKMAFQFQNRAYFSDYLDGEPGSTNRAVGCNCMPLPQDEIDRNCPKGHWKCVEKLKRDAGCTDRCLEDHGPFTSDTNSYNFFAIYAPKGSQVKYNIEVEMFFYNHTMLGKHYKCTIRGTDVCTFRKPGYMKHDLFKQRERHLIIAYVHPTSVPGYFTTRLVIEARVQVNYLLSIAALCACVVFFVVKHCLQGTFGVFNSCL